MFINYAHRGASAYAPENTLSAFYLGLQMRANGIETDVRRSKDGHLVLFHDDTMEKTAGIPGGVKDYTLEELRHILIYGQPGFVPDHIVTLEEFLSLFDYRDLTFAVEIKERGVEEDTLNLIRKYGIADKCIFTSFDYPCLVRLRELDKEIRLGYLFEKLTAENLQAAADIRCFQVCPHVDALDREAVERLHRMGYSVRAWGIRDEEAMRRCLDAGVDGGMTINFPDKLTEALERSAEAVGSFG